jgi:hypothetical protein
LETVMRLVPALAVIAFCASGRSAHAASYLQRTLAPDEMAYFQSVASDVMEAINEDLKAHHLPTCGKDTREPRPVGLVRPSGVEPRFWNRRAECPERNPNYSIRIELSGQPPEGGGETQFIKSGPGWTLTKTAGSNRAAYLRVSSPLGRALSIGLARPAVLQVEVEQERAANTLEVARALDPARLSEVLARVVPPADSGRPAAIAPEAKREERTAAARQVLLAIKDLAGMAISSRRDGESLDGEMGDELLHASVGLDASLIDDFSQRNAAPGLVLQAMLPDPTALLDGAEERRLFSGSKGRRGEDARWEGWRLLRQTRKVAGLCGVSEVGLSTAANQAMVYVGCRTGPRGGSGNLYILFRGTTGWAVAYWVELWVS